MDSGQLGSEYRFVIYCDWMRKDVSMKPWIVLAIAALAIACAPPAPVIVEEPMVEPFVEPTATPQCQPAEGVTVEVRRISDTTLGLRVSGLQPGDKPTVIYSTSIPNEGSSMGEMYDFAEGVDENGEFSVDLPGLRPLEGQTSATWDIRFIHARGVECVAVTLP